MTKRFTDNEIWSKDWFLDLSIKQKLLLKFLFDNCDCAGIYEISYRTLKYCFNEEITKEDFKDLKQVIFIDDNTVFIQDFIKFQYGCEINELNPNYSVHKGILKKLNKYKGLVTLTQPLDNSYNVELQDKVKVKDKDTYTSTNSLKEKENLTKEKEKSENPDEWRGEYANVHLTQKQYAKLITEIGNESTTDTLINELSENIATKNPKSPPYDENFPDVHYAILRKYWTYRKTRGAKSPPEIRPVKTTAELVEESRKLWLERLKDDTR